MEFKKREVKTPRLIVKVEFELTDSTLTIEEATRKLEAYFQGYSNHLSNFIVAAMRETGSSMWDFKSLEIL